MSFYEFLMNSYKVETIIGLVSFVLAAVLGFFAYHNSGKMKKIAKIISLADTKNKQKLATALMEVMPSYEIPDLTSKQGFEIIKLNMEKTEREFTAKMKLIKLGILLFSLILLVVIILATIKFDQQSKTDGKSTNIDSIEVKNGHVVVGDGAIINNNEGVEKDSIKKNGIIKNLG